MDGMDQVGLNRPKWIVWTKLDLINLTDRIFDQIGLNRPRLTVWIKLNQINLSGLCGLNWTKWMEHD